MLSESDLAKRKAYQEKYGEGPFITCDAVIIHKGQILLIKRKKWPFEGMLALPGGFLEKNERIQAGTYREVLEETNLELTVASDRMFIADGPARDPRARIVGMASRFILPDPWYVPIKAGDDAAEAEWYGLGTVLALGPSNLAFDHWSIINELTYDIR